MQHVMAKLENEVADFQRTVWQHYAQHGRHDLPWRLPAATGVYDPYSIVVSELMLQQTQVSRVIPKYEQFLTRFPDVQSLASAPLGDVLVAWQGLGYNRRAKFLWQTAQRVVEEFGGTFPETMERLVSLPGIGVNTAGAVMAYAYNKSVVFVETNIRTVYIHHFFDDQVAVNDKSIYAKVAETLPDSQSENSVREWYWALMDYGSHLKQTVGNVSKSSSHYVKQSPFVGSRRAIRGAVIRKLAAQPETFAMLERSIADVRLEDVLTDLLNEGMVSKTGQTYHLT